LISELGEDLRLGDPHVQEEDDIRCGDGSVAVAGRRGHGPTEAEEG
jgi:hypothetical protein